MVIFRCYVSLPEGNYQHEDLNLMFCMALGFPMVPMKTFVYTPWGGGLGGRLTYLDQKGPQFLHTLRS